MSSQVCMLDLRALEVGFSSQVAEIELTIRDAAGAEEPHRLRVACDLDVQGRRIHVRGRIGGDSEAQCHRCASTFARSIKTGFELVLQRGGEGDDDDIVALDDSALEYDLTPRVREAVILEEPIQLLCRPDCKGLCAQCGQDHNVATCQCEAPADPRWNALKKLSDGLQS